MSKRTATVESLDGVTRSKIVFVGRKRTFTKKELGDLLKVAMESNKAISGWLAGIASQQTGQLREMIVVRRDGRELPVEVSI